MAELSESTRQLNKMKVERNTLRSELEAATVCVGRAESAYHLLKRRVRFIKG